MKILILGLPVDNNYGGILQKYALQKVLEKMNNEVECLRLIKKENRPFLLRILVYVKRIVHKVFIDRKTVVFYEKEEDQFYHDSMNAVIPFLEKNIKFTQPIINKKELLNIYRVGNYHAVIVGSDQVWRYDMTKQLGLKTYFLDFVKKEKKISYAASFGVNSYDNRLLKCSFLFKQFTSISIREQTGLDVISCLGWNPKTVKWVLDPTLLLTSSDYVSIFSGKPELHSSKGMAVCYILDNDTEKNKRIQVICGEKGLSPIYLDLSGNSVSVEQWLKYIYEAEFVITDSYHGSVFSILFNKEFEFLGNERRGNSRIESLYKITGYNPLTKFGNWTHINNNIELARNESISFLESSLES